MRTCRKENGFQAVTLGASASTGRALFRAPSTLLTAAPTLSQALHFFVGDTITPRLGCAGALDAYVKGKAQPASVIDELFVRCLNRRPSREELSGFQELIPAPPDNVRPYEDVVWALLNSTEFMFNH